MFRFNFWRSRRGRSRLQYFVSTVLVTVLLTAGLGRAPALASPAQHYTELEFPPLPDVELPDYTRYVMDNGIVVYLVEDHELPLVNGTAMFRAGSRLEPAEQVGLASITGTVMRSGGSVEHPADVLNVLLENKAAAIETNVDEALGSAGFDTLTADLNEVFALFAEVIRTPAFPQDKIDLIKTQFQGAIARRNDNPQDIVSREFQKLVYGSTSPYARTVEYQTLDQISRDDIVRYHQTYFRPDAMLLGIVGDFDTDQMRSLIQEAFGDWQPTGTAPAYALPDVSQASQSGVFLVDQPQLTQSYVQVGHLGGTFSNPDYAALSVLNDILNGLGGRLVNEVRSRQGLAYVVYAVWNARFDYPGVFIGGGQTRSDATVPFIQSVLAQLESVRETPVTEVELQRAKDSVINSFIFSFQTPAQTLSRLMRYEYYGYPADFLFQYREAVENTTAEDILKAAQTHLTPDKIVTLVVGNQAEITPSLSELTPESEVTLVDISIPQPSS